MVGWNCCVRAVRERPLDMAADWDLTVTEDIVFRRLCHRGGSHCIVFWVYAVGDCSLRSWGGVYVADN